MNKIGIMVIGRLGKDTRGFAVGVGLGLLSIWG